MHLVPLSKELQEEGGGVPFEGILYLLSCSLEERRVLSVNSV